MNTEALRDNTPFWIKEEEARQKKELDHLFFLANEKKRVNEAKEQQRAYREQHKNEKQIRRETMKPVRLTTRSFQDIEEDIQELQEATDREIAKKVNQGLVTARYNQTGVALMPRIPKSYTAEYAKHLTRFQRA